MIFPSLDSLLANKVAPFPIILSNIIVGLVFVEQVKMARYPLETEAPLQYSQLY